MMMKSTNLIGVVMTALFLATGVAQAGDGGDQNIIQQNLSKRPYQEAAPNNAHTNTDEWDGATLVKEHQPEKKVGPTQYQQLRIRMLGQRPYMDGNK
jgi:hypothetical protein